MTWHPQAAAFLAEFERDGVAPVHRLSVAQARASAERDAGGPVEPVAGVEDLEVEGDGVRSEAYADRLRAAGVPVEHRR